MGSSTKAEAAPGVAVAQQETAMALSAPVQSGGVRLLRPLAAPAMMIEAHNATRAFVKEVLVPGTDYGVIPGTDKPTLLKPGAEKVTLGFGCTAVPRIVEKEIDHERELRWVKRKAKWDGYGKNRRKVGEEVTEGVSLGLYRYVVEVQIIDGAGEVRGSGIGTCSTLEAKYADRPREVENTVLKMATKRAHVAAALGTFGLSDTFTQDVEDMPSVNGGQASPDDPPAVKAKMASGGGADPREFVKSFGNEHNGKGKMLGEIDDETLRSSIAWAEDKPKLAEFVANARAVLALNEKEEAAAAGGAAEAPADQAPERTPENPVGFAARDRGADAPPPDDDDLPF